MGKITKKVHLILKSSWTFWVKVALGPLSFFIIKSIPILGLEPNGKFVLAVYAWIISWWVMQPLPWGITSLLPLIILPVGGVMKLSDVATLYGQRLLFFIVGVLLFGQAVQKHGLGKRIALNFLNFKWVGGSVYRILFVFLSSIAVLSAFIDDAAAIALGIPIGMSIINYTIEIKKKIDNKTWSTHKLQAFMVLGVLYAAEAGGITTVAGIPHIATAISVMEKTVNQTVSFVQWSQIGLIIGIVSFLTYWGVLRFFFKPEFKNIPGAKEFFLEEKIKLGLLSKGEWNTLIVFFIMLILWITPIFLTIPFLDIWIVPIIGVVLLYLLPVNAHNQCTLVAKDLQELPWNVIFLTLCGSVMATVTIDFGIIQWIQFAIPTAFNSNILLYVAGFSTAGMSNFISGVATVNIIGNILFPVASTLGIDVNILVRILPATGMAILFPWAGAATGTAFSSGKIKIIDMIKCGFVATILHVIVVVIVSSVLVKLLINP
ncbi:MAG: SLC13 family permease [Eubacteriales bacterium]